MGQPSVPLPAERRCCSLRGQREGLRYSSQTVSIRRLGGISCSFVDLECLFEKQA